MIPEGFDHDSHDPSACRLLEEMVNETQDRTELRHQIMNVFFPARDSTAIAVSNVFFQLARHPNVWHRLREEISATVSGPLDFEMLSSMKYLRYVLNESESRMRDHVRLQVLSY